MASLLVYQKNHVIKATLNTPGNEHNHPGCGHSFKARDFYFKSLIIKLVKEHPTCTNRQILDLAAAENGGEVVLKPGSNVNDSQGPVKNLLAFVRFWQRNINGEDVLTRGRRGSSAQYQSGVRRGKDSAEAGRIATNKKADPAASATTETERRMQAIAAAAQGYLSANNPYML